MKKPRLNLTKDLSDINSQLFSLEENAEGHKLKKDRDFNGREVNPRL